MNGVEVTSVGGFELESSMTSAAGQWTLCYCAARRNGCDDREDFVLDFGTLHILGPLRQDLTCFAGPPSFKKRVVCISGKRVPRWKR